MIVKLDAESRLTIPKELISKMKNPEYFEMSFENGQIILTPVYINIGDAVRKKLSVIGITEQDVEEAVELCRKK